MLVRAVRLEFLVIDDVHITAREIAEMITEAIQAHVECRRVEFKIIEDHEIASDLAPELGMAEA